MEKDLFIQLVNRYLDGTATAEERRLLDACYHRLQHDVPVTLLPQEEAALRERMLHNINAALLADETPVVKMKTRYWWKYTAAAALLGAIVAVSSYFLLRPQETTRHPLATIKEYKGPVPGYNKATLTLGNGSVVQLDSTGNQVIRQGNVSVYQQKGQLRYEAKGSATATAFNTLTTPRGAQFRLTLPDGSIVWLNAASQIKFPTSFQGAERNVTLTGEAYFEIAANAQQPFMVTANGVAVKVLGTHFNVMAYTDEPFVKTTLMQGSVKVCREKKEVLLAPGQAAIASYQRTDIQVQQANTVEAVAWKNGYFVFNDENLESIMKKIVRYYDVEVVYKTDISHKNFGGSVARFSSLTELLETLELTGDVHFNIEGNKVIVLP
ncbi:FecR domain-containing protein [Chitinophaga sp. MM2321]|uniref:FecR domain-containing protein n=1 Tax=Chitinophaga sp. MM2321 TaxID=3137178 RepID=UPI0032D5792E